MESRLVQLALEAKTAQIDNRNLPSLPSLHEADISDMEYFLEQMELTLPVMGFNFLTPSTITPKQNHTLENKPQVHETYFIKTKKFQASMTETDQGYIVSKISEAKKSLSNSCTKTYRNMRKKLIETQIMIENEDKLIFEEGAVFNSPSSSSNTILGGNSNRFSEWINKKGLTFKEVQEKINN